MKAFVTFIRTLFNSQATLASARALRRPFSLRVRRQGLVRALLTLLAALLLGTGLSVLQACNSQPQPAVQPEVRASVQAPGQTTGQAVDRAASQASERAQDRASERVSDRASGGVADWTRDRASGGQLSVPRIGHLAEQPIVLPIGPPTGLPDRGPTASVPWRWVIFLPRRAKRWR